MPKGRNAHNYKTLCRERRPFSILTHIVSRAQAAFLSSRRRKRLSRQPLPRIQALKHFFLFPYTGSTSGPVFGLLPFSFIISSFLAIMLAYWNSLC
jgi:hypothetical protein